MTANVRIDLLHYPVLEFSKGMMFPARDMNDLRQCTSAALRSGFFNDMTLVDSSGRALKIVGATKVRGVGPFFGFDIFLNQKIEVELATAGAERDVEVDEVRKLVLVALERGHTWNATGDLDELVALVNSAKTIPEIASAVTAAYR